MYIILILIITFIIIGIVGNIIYDKIAKKNSNEIDEKLGQVGFKTSQIRVLDMLDNRQQLRVDSEHKKIAICNIFPQQNINILNFSDIIECEIVQDSKTIIKDGIGRAIIGGAIAGSVGAIIASNTIETKDVTNNLYIKIITKDINNSLHIINIIKAETKKYSTEYKTAINFANNVYATLTSIMNGNNNNDLQSDNSKDFIEQLERLSKLKSDEIITNKEFEAIKQKILDNKNETFGKEETIIDNDIYKIEQKIQLYNNNKIRIINELMNETGLGLPAAKKIVDDYMKNR
ncbi:MAG: SHOCT domain-containing protein [Clostridia bacterium]|nr:SHOCT domain-containing protein [Clostridia bacterium]